MFESKGIDINVTEEDLDILSENTVDFHTFSYYSSSVVDVVNEHPNSKGNMMMGVENPHLKARE